MHSRFLRHHHPTQRAKPLYLVVHLYSVLYFATRILLKTCIEQVIARAHKTVPACLHSAQVNPHSVHQLSHPTLRSGGPSAGPIKAMGCPSGMSHQHTRSYLTSGRSCLSHHPISCSSAGKAISRSTLPASSNSRRKRQPNSPHSRRHSRMQLTSNKRKGPAPVRPFPPHLAQNAAPSLGTAPSVSSQSEVGLDPNDFPALGATPANNSSAASSGNTASYATQAGTGAGASGAQAGNGAAVNQPRDFTAEDFPALGGQSQATPQQAQQAQQIPTEGHPPWVERLSARRPATSTEPPRLANKRGSGAAATRVVEFGADEKCASGLPV